MNAADRAELCKDLVANPEATLEAYETLLSEAEELRQINLLGPSEKLEYQHALEDLLRTAIEAGLGPVLGKGRLAVYAALLEGRTTTLEILETFKS